MRKTLIIFLSFFYLIVNGQELKVSTNNNPAIVGEQILIQYSIDKEVEKFISPNFNGLQILSGPNPSTQNSITIINGKREIKNNTTYSFYLKANKEGTYTITPASVKTKNKIIESNPFNLRVIKGSEKTANEKKSLAKNLFIKVDVNKRNIVIGEQILVTYKLCTRLDLHNTELSSLPNLNGFWKKDLEVSSKFKRDVINGVAYNVAVVKKCVLTAQKTGKLTLDPMQLKCSIRIQNNTRSRDPFASFFGGSFNVQEEIIASKPITINVAELPPSPSKFKGIVGNMNITSKIDRATVKENDAITYQLSIIGTGNIELIESPEINFPKDFEVYDPKITQKIFEGGRKRSTKTFEYLLIPRFKGEYLIPETNMIIYNHITKKYETKSSNKHTLNVIAGNEEQQIQSIQQETIKKNKKDINYIFNTTKLKTNYLNIIRPNIFYPLFFSPIILLLLLFLYQKIIRKKLLNHSIQKNKKANKIARKRLKNAEKCIKSENFDLFFEEIEKALWQYFAYKFKVSIANLSKETISLYFNKSGVKESTKEQFINLLDSCELARYAPAKNKNIETNNLLSKAQEIIVNVENELK